MKKASLGAVVALLAALAFVLPTQAAQAAADPYEDLVCDIAVSSTSVQGGEEFAITVTSDRPAELSASFAGETRTAQDARELVATFRAPVVDQAQSAQISASCDDVARSASIEILPAGVDGDGAGAGTSGEGGAALSGILPDTGGASFWILLLGVALAAVGGAVLIRRRRV